MSMRAASIKINIFSALMAVYIGFSGLSSLAGVHLHHHESQEAEPVALTVHDCPAESHQTSRHNCVPESLLEHLLESSLAGSKQKHNKDVRYVKSAQLILLQKDRLLAKRPVRFIVHSRSNRVNSSPLAPRPPPALV